LRTHWLQVCFSHGLGVKPITHRQSLVSDTTVSHTAATTTGDVMSGDEKARICRDAACNSLVFVFNRRRRLDSLSYASKHAGISVHLAFSFKSILVMVSEMVRPGRSSSDIWVISTLPRTGCTLRTNWTPDTPDVASRITTTFGFMFSLSSLSKHVNLSL